MSAMTGPPSAGTPLPAGTSRPSSGAGAPNVPRPRSADRGGELDLPSRIEQLMPRARADLAELVAFRSVADPRLGRPDECNQAARWVLGRFEEVGFTDVYLAETRDDSRAVVGSTPPSSEPGVPRVLLYAHYDVHPVTDEEQWATPPFTLTEVDGRWHARGSADCKGNILAHLTALRALDDLSGVDLRLLMTGSQEQGAEVLEEFLQRHVDLLRADVVLVSDIYSLRRASQEGPSAHGPAYEALRAATAEAYGEPEGETVHGGAAGTLKVFAEAFPEAEVLALDVADRRSSIHRADESVDPARLAATALAEALFLQRLAAGPA